MKKSVKIILAVVATVVVLAAVWLVRCWFSDCGNIEADVVMVNDSETAIGSASVDTEAGIEIGQNADNSLMDRGAYIGFGDEECPVEYPAVVTVYASIGGRTPLASCTLEKAPEGERWYVVLKDGPDGLVLEPTAEWPPDGWKG